MGNVRDGTRRVAGQPDSFETTYVLGRRRRSMAARKLWPVLVSVLVGVLLMPAIAYGLISDSAYRGYGQDLVLASRAQDLLTTLVIPVLVWASVRSQRGSPPAHLLWLGLMFYISYSYAIYLIGWPQNRAFLIYVLVVLLSAAALVDGVVRVDPSAVRPAVRIFRVTCLGWFLVVVGVAFTGLWLTDVGPSVWGGRAPVQLGPGGTAYAVYVLDLTVALPMVIATGVLLLRRHPMAVVLAGIVLVKITTLFTALWLGVLAQLAVGQHVPFTADMVPSAVLPVVTIVVLVRAARHLGRSDDGWIRDEIWPQRLRHELSLHAPHQPTYRTGLRPT
jgi:hypothetical protein